MIDVIFAALHIYGDFKFIKKKIVVLITGKSLFCLRQLKICTFFFFPKRENQWLDKIGFVNFLYH